MLAAIRAFAKTPYAAALIVLLIASFAVFGIRDVFKGSVSNAVITAGSRSVDSVDFKREFDGYKARLEQQTHQPISLEVINANALDRRVLEGVATREAFAGLVAKMGIQPSDKLIGQEIQKIPAFFDQVSGRFDKQAFQKRLMDNGLTPAKFDQTMRDEISQQHVATGMVAGMRVPRAYTALAAIYGLEARDVAFFPVDPSSVAQPAPPTDAELTAFMAQNKAALMRPEFRTITVVRFSPSQVAANQPVDEAEVKKRFDFRKDTLSTPPTRTVIQIPAKSPQAAAQIGARLLKGEDPAAVAKSTGVDLITYDNKPQSAIADRKVAVAAFALPAGQSAAVQGDLGSAVIKVISVTPGKPVTLDEVRPALEAEIRKDNAAEKVYALTQTYDEAHQGGMNLADSAKKAGVPTLSLGPMSQQGRDPQGQPVPGLTQKLVETAFALPAGGESEIEDAGGGEFFAVRVEKVTPSAVPPLEEVRPQLTKVWMGRELAKRMQARANELSARVTKGESLDAVAASAGVSVTRVPGVSRQSASQAPNPAMSQDMLIKSFGAKPGEVFTAQANHFGFVVGKLEAIHSGDPATLARLTENMRPQMTMAIFREISESAQQAARQRVKVTADVNKARAAIGLDPIEASKPADAKPAKAK